VESNNSQTRRKYQTLQQKFLPGSTPIPNWFLDHILPDEEVSSDVLRVFLFLIRKTIGWNNSSEEKSLSQIMEGCVLRSRHTAIHAVTVLCDCWGLWKKVRGRKGQHSSIYSPAAIANEDELHSRMMATSYIYDTVCPTLDQLRDLPPTQKLYETVLRLMQIEDYRERDLQITTVIREARIEGHHMRQIQAADKRRKVEQKRKASAQNAPTSAMDAPLEVH